MVVRRTKEEWEEIIAAYKESGQSQSVFCREHGLSVKTLGANIRKGRVKEGSTKKPLVQRSTEEWARLISEQRASGMNRAAWCRKHGVSPDSMLSAARRMTSQNQDERDSEWIEFSLGAKVVTSPEKTSGENWGIRIRGGDMDIEVSADYPVEKLAVLIGKLVKA